VHVIPEIDIWRAANLMLKRYGDKARAAVRKLFLIKPLGHARLRFAGVRADHRSGIELAAIDATTAANGRDGW
jgi:hypothetical protein